MTRKMGITARYRITDPNPVEEGIAKASSDTDGFAVSMLGKN